MHGPKLKMYEEYKKNKSPFPSIYSQLDRHGLSLSLSLPQPPPQPNNSSHTFINSGGSLSIKVLKSLHFQPVRFLANI